MKKLSLMSPRMRRFRLTAYCFALFAGLLSFACASSFSAPAGAVHVLTADGVVNPVMDRYIERGLDAAADEDAALVVIRLDTPGGLITSMNAIIKNILASEVPVAVYVTPPGGQAASAGTFITLAGHVAAMAPNTRIGAATPVGGGGEEIQGPLGDKITNDAVALIRGLAERYDRNADWAESAVREATAADANEALELNVIDLVASDLDDLLLRIDGLNVRMEGDREVTITTRDALVVFNNKNFIENFLDIIANPNIAFLLLSLGSLAIFIEIINPGQIFPGVFGVIALLMGFFALSVLPFNWVGVALIMFAFILFGLEIFVSSGGILGIGGVVALVLGGLLLTSGNPPEFRVEPWVVYALAATLGAMVLFVLVNIVRIRKLPAQVGMETLVGHEAVARTDFSPDGFVFLEGERWSADAEDGEPIQTGDKVIVTEVKGLRLKVRKQKSEGG